MSLKNRTYEDEDEESEIRDTVSKNPLCAKSDEEHGADKNPREKGHALRRVSIKYSPNDLVN